MCGGGFSADLVATGTVEDVAASSTSSRIEIRVDRVLLGDRDYSGETLFITSDSGSNGGDTQAVSFREGVRYEFHLQRDGDAWKTSICLGTTELEGPPVTMSTEPGGTAASGAPTMPETGGPASVLLFAALGGLALDIGVAFRWREHRS